MLAINYIPAFKVSAQGHSAGRMCSMCPELTFSGEPPKLASPV